MVDDIQLQTALASHIIGGFPAFQVILTAGHFHKPHICPGYDPVKVGSLDIGFQHNALFALDAAVGGIGKGAHPLLLLFQRGQLRGFLPDALAAGAVRGQSVVDGFLLLQTLCFLSHQRSFFPGQIIQVNGSTFLQLFFQLDYRSRDRCQFVLCRCMILQCLLEGILKHVLLLFQGFFSGNGGRFCFEIQFFFQRRQLFRQGPDGGRCCCRGFPGGCEFLFRSRQHGFLLRNPAIQDVSAVPGGFDLPDLCLHFFYGNQ